MNLDENDLPPNPNDHLTPFGVLYQDNLRKHRPKEYRQLKESGQLKARVLDIQDQARLMLEQAQANGATYHEAYEKVALELLYPPSENPNRL